MLVWRLAIRGLVPSEHAMGIYDDDEGVAQYLEMADGYDGAELVKELAAMLAPGSHVLELGMGPGKDLALMADAGLTVTGSDTSEPFLRRYREGGGPAPTLMLDAITVETEQSFDAIYSNKVLQHLSEEEMARALARHAEVVGEGGLVFHAIWHGEGIEHHGGMRFLYWTLPALRTVVPSTLEEVGWARYGEMEDADSLWVAWRVKPRSAEG